MRIKVNNFVSDLHNIDLIKVHLINQTFKILLLINITNKNQVNNKN